MTDKEIIEAGQRVAQDLLQDADDLGSWEHISTPAARVMNRVHASFLRPDLSEVLWDEDTTIIWNDGGSDGLE